MPVSAHRTTVKHQHCFRSSSSIPLAEVRGTLDQLPRERTPPAKTGLTWPPAGGPGSTTESTSSSGCATTSPSASAAAASPCAPATSPTRAAFSPEKDQAPAASSPDPNVLHIVPGHDRTRPAGPGKCLSPGDWGLANRGRSAGDRHPGTEHMWRWRESNPRPSVLHQDFSGRSLR